MFWKNLNSKEYKELKLQVELLWIEIDVITKRWQRKAVKKIPAAQETEGIGQPTNIDDGFDELRKLNKEQKP